MQRKRTATKLRFAFVGVVPVAPANDMVVPPWLGITNDSTAAVAVVIVRLHWRASVKLATGTGRPLIVPTRRWQLKDRLIAHRHTPWCRPAWKERVQPER